MCVTLLTLQLITQAYEVLRDTKLRQLYDQHGLRALHSHTDLLQYLQGGSRYRARAHSVAYPWVCCLGLQPSVWRQLAVYLCIMLNAVTDPGCDMVSTGLCPRAPCLTSATQSKLQSSSAAMCCVRVSRDLGSSCSHGFAACPVRQPSVVPLRVPPS